MKGLQNHIRRFLLHVLPRGFHRIRHCGFLGNGNRAANIARIRELLAARAPTSDTKGPAPQTGRASSRSRVPAVADA